MNNRYIESWREALLWAIAVLWFIFGAAAPAPLMPFVAVSQIGWPMATTLAIIATILWFGIPYLLIKWADRIRNRRLKE